MSRKDLLAMLVAAANLIAALLAIIEKLVK